MAVGSLRHGNHCGGKTRCGEGACTTCIPVRIKTMPCFCEVFFAPCRAHKLSLKGQALLCFLTTDCQLSRTPKTRPKAFATPRHSPAVAPFLRRPHTNETPSQSMRRPHDPSHSTRKRTLALRGAQGDRRAKRGSSRSRSRAALAECRMLENPSGVLRGGCKGGREGGAAP